MSKHVIENQQLQCTKEYQQGPIEPKEFFIFPTSNLVWCNVFKSASTRFVNQSLHLYITMPKAILHKIYIIKRA